MSLTRREFFKRTGAGGILSVLGLSLGKSAVFAEAARVKGGKMSTTICPYCGVGCGAIVTESAGKVVSVEGDPDHPINEGALCSKGSALFQVANSDRRAMKVLYRAPGSANWEEKEWDWALEKIAKNIKATRDASFMATDSQGREVNRTEAIACLGGAALDSEECYAYSKFARSLGVVYLEHQARI